ncbi:MAG: hypothetical protein NLN66_02155, partial [Candidatus Thalassarchaeaceae archaeon]|nr:hypothetical protein [Candidatus Thalassarchaeaceae archaeon]
MGAVDNLGESYLNIAGFQQGSALTYSTLAGGVKHTCAILDDGSVNCWGDNNYGQLGDGTNTDRHTPTQTSSLGSGRTAIAISTGEYHTCAILDDGSVSCWGKNNYAQLGDGTTTNRNTPTQTSSLGTDRTAVSITADYGHTCAILDDGSVSCWGENGNGQLGDGTTTDRYTPTPTASLGEGRTAVAIGAGSYHTCTILDDGSVSCWGNNGNGRLGDGTTGTRLTPTQTSSLGTDRTAVAIVSGHQHTCAILDDRSVSCWGMNNYGQLGDGTTGQRTTPTQTSSLGTDRTAVAITPGRFHTCAILDDGSVSCWGNNQNGAIGDGTTGTDRTTPTQTSSLGTDRTAVAITAGRLHTCAVIVTEGSSGEYYGAEVKCWGWNSDGQLGDGTTTDQHTPTQTSSLATDRTAVAISTGESHSCAILDDGSVSCWGRNQKGQLGDGTTTQRLTPTQTSSLGTGRTAVAITSGYYHTCAILDDGSVSCWGTNTKGQLGDGTTTEKHTPTQTSSLGSGRTAVAITAGHSHTCALLDDA